MKEKRTAKDIIKNPGPVMLAAVYTATAAAVAASVALTALDLMLPPVYALYAIAVAGLAYSIYTIVTGIPKLRKKLVEKAGKREFTNKLVSDYVFRTAALAAVSFAVNVGYAVFNGVLAIVSLSVWYGALAAYYLLLSVARLGVLAGSRMAKKRSADGEELEENKLKIFRACGVFLFVLEFGLAAAVTQMIMSPRPSSQDEIMAISSAAYAFYKITIAIVNLVKAGKLRDPVVQSLRNIGLTDALVSMLALEVTLVTVFSDGDETNMITMRCLNAVTGFGICALTMGIGIYMVVRAGILLKKRKELAPEAEPAAKEEQTEDEGRQR